MLEEEGRARIKLQEELHSLSIRQCANPVFLFQLEDAKTVLEE